MASSDDIDLDSIDVFQPDALDRAVTGYEENVPLAAQIVAGLTPPGMAIDIAAAGKYGRDATRAISEGNLGRGGIAAGIAGLSLLGAVPLFGDLAKGPKSVLKQKLKKGTQPGGIGNLPTQNQRFGFTRHQKDLFTGNPLADANRMYLRALKIGPEFKTQMDDLARKLSLETKLPEVAVRIDNTTGLPIGIIKNVPRTVEKARDKYQGDVTQITDPIRSRIIVETPAQEEAVAKLLSQKYDVFDKGREIKPGTGFVDRKINIAFTGSNGEKLVAELGIITAPMVRAGDKSHIKYEQFRSLFPEGMPTSAEELAKIGDDIVKQGEALQKEMAEIFEEAKAQIDPDFYNVGVKKFAEGGYVTSGSSGRSLPMTPNFLSKSAFDISSPSTKKSANWLGSANVQSELPGNMKKPKYPSSTGSTTAGPSSQVKYFMHSSLQKFTKNYNSNDVDIFEVE